MGGKISAFRVFSGGKVKPVAMRIPRRDQARKAAIESVRRTIINKKLSSTIAPNNIK